MQWNEVVNAIQDEIAEIRKKYVINNDIIRDDVFGILEKYCTVLYYPIEDEKNCGFHIKKIVNDKQEEFVYINSAKTLEEQVFTAAHELGHIWNVAQHVWEATVQKGELCLQDEEAITNRFAAELLMPTKIFRETFKEHLKNENMNIKSVTLGDLAKLIALQMNDYLVPYDAVRKRLHEADIITDAGRDFLKGKKIREYVTDAVEKYINEMNTRLGEKKATTTISGIRNLLEEAERKSSLDSYSIQKIKSDFNIEEVTTEEQIIEIQLGENGYGQDGSIG